MISVSTETSSSFDGPIIAALDGSANARHALDVAAAMAKALGTELVVVHALGMLTEIDGEHVPLAGHESEVAERLETEWCAHLQEDPSLRWRVQCEFGPPSDVILRVAAADDPSFVVVGSRGLADRPERLLGSTSHRVVHHADCPVVVVPPRRPA